MKKALTLLIALLCAWASYAQQLNAAKGQIVAEFGGVSCKFLYKNSQGEKASNLYPQNHFTCEAGYQKNVSKKALVSAKVTYNRYGVMGSNEKYRNYFDWRMRYLGIAIGTDLELLKPGAFHLQLKLAAEPQFMIGGTQTINSQVYPLRKVEQFNNPFFFVKAGLGFNYCYDEFTALSVKYMYGLGLPTGSSGDSEKLMLQTNTLSLGIFISLKRCEYCYSRKYKTQSATTTN